MDNGWMVEQKQWEPQKERFYESLFSLGNGYMGLRGTMEETYSADTLKGMYLGGVWYPDKTRVGWWKNGYPEYFGKVINAPAAIDIRVFVNDEELDMARLPVLSFSRELNMKTGCLTRSVSLKTKPGQVKLTAERFVSMHQKQLLFTRVCVTPDYEATVRIDAVIDAHVHNEDSNYQETFWEYLEENASAETAGILVKTRQNPFGTPRFTVCYGMACQTPDLNTEGSAHASFEGAESKEGFAAQKYRWELKKGESACLEKAVAVVTDRDEDAETLMPMAQTMADHAAANGYDAAFDAHKAVWNAKWAQSDVVIEGDEQAQQGIRFNLFELFSTYTGDDERLNIGPKGFTGEKYGGATYWDTEAYCLPVYMATAGQKVARQLLLYRRQQLEKACENAKKLGLKGALYPMVTFTGDECHNEWEITFEEIHRNAAIAYVIYNYTSYTGDESYRTGEGFDVLLAIARFWVSRAHYSKRNAKYMIHGVTGPNEYENNVNNNWYTNRMAVWCLDYCVETAKACTPERLLKAGTNEQELDRFTLVARDMYLPEDKKLGIFVQNDTYLDKELLPAEAIPEQERPICRHWSWDHILRSCYIKQADVLQGLYFLGNEYDLNVKKRNFDFYEPMTVHESSLSPCVHSILASEIGERDKAVSLYQRTARLDLDNINHDTADGLHITSMSGGWLAIVQGFAGMRTFDGLDFSPYLPQGWTGYAFKINYRGRIIALTISQETVTLSLQKGDELTIGLYGIKHRLKTNEDTVCKLS